MLRGCICRVVFARDINKDEVLVYEELGSSGLSLIEDLGWYEDFEISMIGEDLDGMARTFKVVVPVFHGSENGEHLTVMDVIIAFSWKAFF